jgi:hypothetical protein
MRFIKCEDTHQCISTILRFELYRMRKAITISLFLIILITLCTPCHAQSASNEQQTDIRLPFTMKLPNNQWSLAVNKGPVNYIFKRQPIKDAEGRDIIPAIMIYVQDASSYKQDVTRFLGQKMQPLTDKGVKAEKVLIQQDKDYPLSYKNAVFVQGAYTANDVDHVIYMIYIIDKNDKGIQIYLDMTKEVYSIYGHEFWDFIHSIKEIN